MVEKWHEKWGIPIHDDVEVSQEADDDFPREPEMALTTDSILSALGRTSLLDILIDLSKRASDFSEDQNPFYLKQPNSSNALTHVFVRRMYEEHMRLFNQPLWETLALITSIALDLPDTLSADDIRPIVLTGRKQRD